jgi:hypothetical protein
VGGEEGGLVPLPKPPGEEVKPPGPALPGEEGLGPLQEEPGLGGVQGQGPEDQEAGEARRPQEGEEAPEEVPGPPGASPEEVGQGQGVPREEAHPGEGVGQEGLRLLQDLEERLGAEEELQAQVVEGGPGGGVLKAGEGGVGQGLGPAQALQGHGQGHVEPGLPLGVPPEAEDGLLQGQGARPRGEGQAQVVEGEGGLGPSGGLQGQGAVGPKVPLACLHEAQKGQALRLQGAFLGGEEEGLRLPVLPLLQEAEGWGEERLVHRGSLQAPSFLGREGSHVGGAPLGLASGSNHGAAAWSSLASGRRLSTSRTRGRR